MLLSELHDRAPVHSWASSKEQIEKAFGKPVEELFDSIDHKALASGSIAQASPCCALCMFFCFVWMGSLEIPFCCLTQPLFLPSLRG
jgi:hypothetical protein